MSTARSKGGKTTEPTDTQQNNSPTDSLTTETTQDSNSDEEFDYSAAYPSSDSPTSQESTQQTSQSYSPSTQGNQGAQGNNHMGAYAMSGLFRITHFNGNRVSFQAYDQGFDGVYGFAHGSGTFEMTVGGDAYAALHDAYTNGTPVEWVFLVPKSAKNTNNASLSATQG